MPRHIYGAWAIEPRLLPRSNEVRVPRNEVQEYEKYSFRIARGRVFKNHAKKGTLSL